METIAKEASEVDMTKIESKLSTMVKSELGTLTKVISQNYVDTGKVGTRYSDIYLG